MVDTDDTDNATSLAPLPLDEFNTEQAAERFVLCWAMEHGYASLEKTIKKDKHDVIRRCDFRCAKGGVQRVQGVKRATGTRIVECPFEFGSTVPSMAPGGPPT